MKLLLAILVCISLLSGAVPAAPFCQERMAVPDRALQREALDLIKALFDSSYRNETQVAQRELAERLLERGCDPAVRPVEQYVLLSESLRISTESAAPETGQTAIEVLEQNFLVDSTGLRTGFLETIGGNFDTPEQLYTTVRIADRWIEAAMDNNSFDAAADVLQSVNKMARAAEQPVLMTITERRIKECRQLIREFRKVRPSVERLAEDPDDDDASRILGEFYLLIKGDFEKGLRLVARSNSQYSDLAEQELSGAVVDTDTTLSLADQWWDSADQNLHILEHASNLYNEILDQTSGLTERRIQQRLEQFKILKTRHSGAAVETVIGHAWNVKWDNGHPEWENAVFTIDGVSRIRNNNREYRNNFLIDSNMLRWNSRDGRFLFVVQFDGMNLRCMKYNSVSGEMLDLGIGTMIENTPRTNNQ